MYNNMDLKIIQSNTLKNILSFCIVLSLYLMFRGYLLNGIYYFNLEEEPLFFSEYIFGHLGLNFWMSIGIGIVNLYLLYSIGFKLYSKHFGFFLAMMYAISPWSAYVDIFGGSSTYLLSWVLTVVLSLILLKQHYKWSMILLFLSLIGMLTAAIVSLSVLGTLLFGIYIIKYFTRKQLIKLYGISLITVLVLIFMLFINIDATKNLIRRNTEFFQDIGAVNTVNTLRGETNAAGFSNIGRIVENKYLYVGKRLLLNFSMNFSPSLYFTSQFKLFDFSFSPPIFLGFIIPCVLGIITLSKQKKYLIVSVLVILGLSLPSVLDKSPPDLTKLVLISPIIYGYIALGLTKMTDNIKSPIFLKLLFITYFIVILQVLVVVGDITLRERVRFEMFFNQFS